MNSLRSLLVLSALALPTFSHAADLGTFYFFTGQTTANTKISDLPATDLWAPSSYLAACGAPSCEPQVYTVDALDLTSATDTWTLGGGNFTIKTSGAQDDLLFSVWDVTSTPTLLESAAFPHASGTNSYTATEIDFTSPQQLQIGHKYYAVLTSAGTSDNKAWFIKGASGVSITVNQDGTGGTLPSSPPVPPSSTPEPATMMMLGGGFSLIGLSRFFKRKQ